MLYQAYQLQSDLVSPLRLMAQHLSATLWLQKTERSLLRRCPPPATCSRACA
jgi:poly(3-hydroxybutyrate) depolymerase